MFLLNANLARDQEVRSRVRSLILLGAHWRRLDEGEIRGACHSELQ